MLSGPKYDFMFLKQTVTNHYQFNEESLDLNSLYSKSPFQFPLKLRINLSKVIADVTILTTGCITHRTELLKNGYQ